MAVRTMRSRTFRGRGFASASLVAFSLIAVAGCSSQGTSARPVSEHHKAVAVNAVPTKISSTCKSAADYSFSPAYEVQKLGTVVSPSSLLSEVQNYSEVFIGSKGYALAIVNSQTYPAITLDGGATWRINGPMLYHAAADGGQVVSEIGAAPPNWEFIWGAGNLVDFSRDGGNHWCEVNMGGPVLSVGANPPDMWATLGSPPEQGRFAEQMATYVSGDSGNTWTPSSGSK
jgi:hypothetical protein